MHTLLAVAAVGIVSGIVGALAAARLGRYPHRYPDESDLRQMDFRWVAPATALAAMGVWWALAPRFPVLVAVVYVVMTWAMVPLAAVDLDVHRLPDAIQLPAYPVVLALLALCSAVTADWGALGRAAICGVILFAVFLLMALVGPQGGMGGGDIKLAGIVGMQLGWLGWRHLEVGALGTFLLGGVFAVVLLAMRRVGRQGEVAYGPAMLGSTILTVALLHG